MRLLNEGKMEPLAWSIQPANFREVTRLPYPLTKNSLI